MTKSRQHLLLLTLFENAPAIVFLAILHWTSDLQIAGWCGAFVAAVVCTAYLIRTLKPHTILLGINLYLLLITPAIETLLRLDFDGLANVLIGDAQSFVLVAIFLTGVVLTAVAKNGFVGASSAQRKRVVQYSLVLLCASLLSVVWTFMVHAERFLEIGVPLLLLFGVRQFLVARLEDHENRQSGGYLAAPAAIGADAREFDVGA